jgi:hypothetical protein
MISLADYACGLHAAAEAPQSLGNTGQADECVSSETGPRKPRRFR